MVNANNQNNRLILKRNSRVTKVKQRKLLSEFKRQKIQD